MVIYYVCGYFLSCSVLTQPDNEPKIQMMQYILFMYLLLKLPLHDVQVCPLVV